MDIPRHIKDDPKWKALTDKVRTNLGKILQPYRVGQLVEYGDHYDYRKGDFARLKGILNRVNFRFHEQNLSPKRRHNQMQRDLFVTFDILCIWDGVLPVTKNDLIEVSGTTDVNKFFFGKTLSVLCEPE